MQRKSVKRDNAQRKSVSRREFVQTTAAAGVGFWVAGSALADDLKSKSANERVQFACIGVGGKGDSDSNDAHRTGDIVAICDVDDNTARKKAAGLKGVKIFHDFRKMLDEMGKSIDAVTVSIPDHNHAAASLLYMRAGKHCFCQKPMTHYIYEADLVGKVAAEKKVATQMGNQGTASDSLRESAAKIRAGACGTVKEVHVWTNRPIWPQGKGRPADAPVPKNLHWEQWIGPAKFRPYANGYHPFSWRGFWDFGTGALGDMACHTVNLPFMALDLFDPISVEAETSGNNKEMYPNWSVIKFEFPSYQGRAPLSLTWYDGKKMPSKELFAADKDIASGKKRIDSSGCLVVGDKGSYYCPGDYGGQGHQALGGATEPKIEFPHSPGHFDEWVRAIKGGEPAMSNFPNYASRLTKTILLGNLAVWAGTKVEWDPKALKATNLPDLEPMIHPRYREGYSLEG
ncbi:MAG TPA: Gfo/Idh/MocA family oxidoreductase [Pirellulales bacterium]|jgi:predicted dehydrogenase|nr:Gfo/Idh/MocA family oxidoreductase [Pirellulales bacterium]